MQLSFFLEHVAPSAASSCGTPPGATSYVALPHADLAAPNTASTHVGRVISYGVSLYGAPPGATTAVPHAGYVIPYAALLHAGYAACNACPTHAGYAAPNAAPIHASRATPYDASLYGAPPGATTAVPHAGYAAPYEALLHAGYAARNTSPTYAGYNAPNVALPHAGHIAFYVAPPASAQTWAPSSPTEWVFDCSATAHLSKDVGILHSFSPHPVRHITVGDGSSVPVSSSSHASLPSFLSNRPLHLHLRDVLVLHLALLKISSPFVSSLLIIIAPSILILLVFL
jgi:hypothetical protein